MRYSLLLLACAKSVFASSLGRTEQESPRRLVKVNRNGSSKEIQTGPGPIRIGSHRIEIPRGEVVLSTTVVAVETKSPAHRRAITDVVQPLTDGPRKKAPGSDPTTPLPDKTRLHPKYKQMFKIFAYIISKVRTRDRRTLFSSAAIECSLEIAHGATVSLLYAFPSEVRSFMDVSQQIIHSYECANALLEDPDISDPIPQMYTLIELILQLNRLEELRRSGGTMQTLLDARDKCRSLFLHLNDDTGSPIVLVFGV